MGSDDGSSGHTRRFTQVDLQIAQKLRAVGLSEEQIASIHQPGISPDERSRLIDEGITDAVARHMADPDSSFRKAALAQAAEDPETRRQATESHREGQGDLPPDPDSTELAGDDLHEDGDDVGSADTLAPAAPTREPGAQHSTAGSATLPRSPSRLGAAAVLLGLVGAISAFVLVNRALGRTACEQLLPPTASLEQVLDRPLRVGTATGGRTCEIPVLDRSSGEPLMHLSAGPRASYADKRGQLERADFEHREPLTVGDEGVLALAGPDTGRSIILIRRGDAYAQMTVEGKLPLARARQLIPLLAARLESLDLVPRD